MGTNFFTNEKENTLLEKIEGVFKYKKVHFFDALVGYFRASGYFRIRKFIQQTPKIRILVGINVDKLTYQANQQGLLFNPNAEQSQEEFFNDIKRNIQEAKYDKEVEDGMYQFIEDIVTGRITMRIHPKQNIHAKIYIFREEVYHPHGYGSVITGSSNLTEAGLEKNFEFNVELRYDDDIQFATETFEKLWEESVEIDIIHIDKIKNNSYLNPNFTPYEVYLKFLLEYFGKSIDFDPNSVSDLPPGYKKLSYQIDAVNDGYAKMIKHNGFFLSDVVGLGKTVVSALIAKKFFFSNGFPTHRSHILVIVPPAMKDNWEETLTEFKLDNFKIITNGSLHKVKNPELYDLIIVDEAHKFRSDTASMYNELQKLCKTKTKRYDGSLHDKKVILVSATPLNNKPEDIANLVYLFQDSKDSTLEEGNLQRFFREHIDRYNKLKKQKDLTLIADEIKAIYERIRIKVVEPLTVRRTRTDLMENDAYRKDLEEQNIHFPDVKSPRKIYYQLDNELETKADGGFLDLQTLWNKLVKFYSDNGRSLEPSMQKLFTDSKLLILNVAAHYQRLSNPIYRIELDKVFKIVDYVKSIEKISNKLIIEGGKQIVFQHPTIDYKCSFELDSDLEIVQDEHIVAIIPKCKNIRWSYNGVENWDFETNQQNNDHILLASTPKMTKFFSNCCEKLPLGISHEMLMLHCKIEGETALIDYLGGIDLLKIAVKTF